MACGQRIEGCTLLRPQVEQVSAGQGSEAMWPGLAQQRQRTGSVRGTVRGSRVM